MQVQLLCVCNVFGVHEGRGVEVGVTVPLTHLVSSVIHGPATALDPHGYLGLADVETSDRLAVHRVKNPLVLPWLQETDALTS